MPRNGSVVVEFRSLGVEGLRNLSKVKVGCRELFTGKALSELTQARSDSGAKGTEFREEAHLQDNDGGDGLPTPSR